MLILANQTVTAQSLKKLLEIGPRHKLCFENLITPTPKKLGETTLFEAVKPIETGHDLFKLLLRDQMNHKTNPKDPIRNCVGPVDVLRLLEPVYNLGFINRIEIAFFSHTLIYRPTDELFVPVIDDKQNVSLVSLSQTWPTYRKVIVMKN